MQAHSRHIHAVHTQAAHPQAIYVHPAPTHTALAHIMPSSAVHADTMHRMFVRWIKIDMPPATKVADLFELFFPRLSMPGLLNISVGLLPKKV